MHHRQTRQTRQPRHSNSQVVPYDPRNGATVSNQHRQQSIDPFSTMFADPLGASLFDEDHHQLMQLGHFGALSRGGFGRSLDGMMSSIMSGGFNHGTPGGSYSSQVMMMSSTIGPDGQPHVEKYARSSTGNSHHQIRETKEAYTNTSSGVDKLAWERQLDNRGRRVVQERTRSTGEVVSNDEIVGMSRDEECDRFNEEWNRTAGLHLPTRPRIHPSMLPHLESPYGQLQPQQSSTRQIQAVDENNQEQQPSRSNRTYRRQQYG